MDVATLGWRTDLLARRLGGSTIEDRGDHVVVRTADNPRFWWGNCLVLQSLPTRDELPRWESVFAAAFPGTTHRAIGVDADVTEVDPAALVDWPGLDRELDVALATGELRAPSRRPGTVRPLESEDDWQRLLDLRISSHAVDRPGTLDPVYEGKRVGEHRRVVEAGDGVWFGAFEGDRLVATCGVLLDGDGLGRYQTVETHPDLRRRGFASQVVHEAGHMALHELGVQTLVILADVDYVAADIYRSLGFVDVERHVQWSRPTQPQTTE